MFARCRVYFGSKSLHAVLNRFKVSGAHPDILAAVDPAKASHNGHALIKLEELLAKRATPLAPNESRDRHELHELTFWIKSKTTGRSEPSVATKLGSEAEMPHDSLQKLTCKLTPYAADTSVKAQLASLFRGAGVTDDFVLPAVEDSADMESVLESARTKHTTHMSQTEELATRGGRSARFLRSLGVVVTLEDRGTLFLITLPERFEPQGGETEMPNEAREWLRQRGLMPMDFRQGGSYSSVEHLVLAVERLERLYRMNQGTTLRPGVCICLTLSGNKNYFADDGSIVLAVTVPHTWEEFLMMIPQPKWVELVEMNKQWKADNPTSLTDLNRKLRRLADALHYHSVQVESTSAGGRTWHTAFASAMLREEAAIRKTVEKYKGQLRFDTLRQRGIIVVRPKVYGRGVTQSRDGSDSEVPAVLAADGKVYVSHELITPVKLLKFLRENNALALKRVTAFDTALAQLEGVARGCYVEMHVDPEFRSTSPDLAARVSKFVKTVKPLQTAIARKMRGPQGTKGLMLLVSDRFNMTASGKTLVPWDVDASTLHSTLQLPK